MVDRDELFRLLIDGKDEGRRQRNIRHCRSFANGEAWKGSRYNGDSRTGSSRRQVHGHDTAHQWVSPDLDHRVFDTGNSLEELRREMLDGIDGYDRRVCVELERCGWRRKVKAGDASKADGPFVS